MTQSKQLEKPGKILNTMLTSGEVACIFGVSVDTVRRWSDQELIKAYRVGPQGSRRYRREDVAVLYLDRAIQKYPQRHHKRPLS